MGKRDRDKKIRQHAQALDEEHEEDGRRPRRRLRLSVRRARTTGSATPQDNSTSPSSSRHARRSVCAKSDLPEILVHDFRKNGYLPEALLNFLALLGWSPGGDRERMTMDEMVQLFSLDRVGKSNPKFDRDKLLAFNTEAAAAATPRAAAGRVQGLTSPPIPTRR